MAVCIDLRNAEDVQLYTLPKPDVSFLKFFVAIGALIAGLLPWMFLRGVDFPTLTDFVLAQAVGLAYGLSLMILSIHAINATWRKYYATRGQIRLMIPMGDSCE